MRPWGQHREGSSQLLGSWATALIITLGLAGTSTAVAALAAAIRVAPLVDSVLLADAFGVYVPLPGTPTYPVAAAGAGPPATAGPPAADDAAAAAGDGAVFAVGACGERVGCTELQFRAGEWRPGSAAPPATEVNAQIRVLLEDATLWRIAADAIGPSRPSRAEP